MARRLKTRLDKLEAASESAELSRDCIDMLVDIFGRTHALFMPLRQKPTSWPAVFQLRRKYFDGTGGISARARGQRNWVAGHETRRALVDRSLAVEVRGAAETTGLLLTHAGRALAFALVGDVIPMYPLSQYFVERLKSLPQERAGGWVSESTLFGCECKGQPGEWQDFTDAMLEPCIQGCVETLATATGRAFYRAIGPAPKPLEMIDIPYGPAAADAYVDAFTGEMARWRTIEAADSSEIVIPLRET